MLNKQNGNMYPWVTHTWNPVKGKCLHDCKYCYMKRFPLNPVRLDEKELDTNLGSGNTIFVGSSCDMWNKNIPKEWLIKILGHCENYLDNSYLFQSKNPFRFNEVLPSDLSVNWSKRVILGTTIETNRDLTYGWEYHISNAPKPVERLDALRCIGAYHKMVSIEPIMDFDLRIMINWIKELNPDFVSIGADSKGHNLSEPSKVKTLDLIIALKRLTDVKIKSNLNRILENPTIR